MKIIILHGSTLWSRNFNAKTIKQSQTAFSFSPFLSSTSFLLICIRLKATRKKWHGSNPRCVDALLWRVNIERMPGLPPLAGLGSRYLEFMVAPGTNRPAAIAAPSSLAALHSHFTPSRVCVTSGIAVSSLTSLSNCMSAQNFLRCMQQRLFIQRMNRGNDFCVLWRSMCCTRVVEFHLRLSQLIYV